MKFPVGICILMGFCLNACTTEGEGSEFITKLASREEANEIVAIPEVSGGLGRVSQADFYSGYIDTSWIRQTFIPGGLYSYNTATKTWSRVDSNKFDINDALAVQKTSYQLEPSNANGFPIQSSTKIIYENKQQNWDNTGYRENYSSITVDNMPLWYPLDGNEQEPSSGTASLGSVYERIKYSPAVNALTVQSETNYTYTTSRIGTGSAIGSGRFKITRESGEPEKIDISIRFKFEAVVDESYTQQFTIYIDFGGYGYKMSNGEIQWTPYELDF